MSDVPPPLPAFASWPTFPFEGELRLKQLDDPVDQEPPRQGEDPADCSACRAPDTAYIWVDERWRVRSLDRPTGLPMVLILESRSHLDLGDLPNLLAAELGVLTVRLERAIRSLDGVARVHVNRWGDGSAHLHVWFLARPYGRLQLRGTFLSLWDDILPRFPESLWRDNLAHVAAWLADFGGRSLAEPPHIDWKAPALLTLPNSGTDDGITRIEVGDEDAVDGLGSAGSTGDHGSAGGYGSAGTEGTGSAYSFGHGTDGAVRVGGTLDSASAGFLLSGARGDGVTGNGGNKDGAGAKDRATDDGATDDGALSGRDTAIEDSAVAGSGAESTIGSGSRPPGGELETGSGRPSSGASETDDREISEISEDSGISGERGAAAAVGPAATRLLPG